MHSRMNVRTMNPSLTLYSVLLGKTCHMCYKNIIKCVCLFRPHFCVFDSLAACKLSNLAIYFTSLFALDYAQIHVVKYVVDVMLQHIALYSSC